MQLFSVLLPCVSCYNMLLLQMTLDYKTSQLKENKSSKVMEEHGQDQKLLKVCTSSIVVLKKKLMWHFYFENLQQQKKPV